MDSDVQPIQLLMMTILLQQLPPPLMKTTTSTGAAADVAYAGDVDAVVADGCFCHVVIYVCAFYTVFSLSDSHYYYQH